MFVEKSARCRNTAGCSEHRSRRPPAGNSAGSSLHRSRTAKAGSSNATAKRTSALAREHGTPVFFSSSQSGRLSKKRRRHFFDTQRNPPESYDFGGFLPNPGRTPLTCIPPACRTAPRTGIDPYVPYSILVVWKLPG